MAWAAVPASTGTDSISMTAVTASDPRGVEYYFQCLSPGGHDSGWQDSATYVDKVSIAGKPYAYRVAARDKSASRNQTAWSQLKPIAWRIISPGH